MNTNPSMKKPFRPLKWVIGIFVLIVICFIGYTWVTLHWSFSEGRRTGYVQQLSKSGWVCKTWEGEMAMVTMPGAIPEKFLFTVREDKVADRINKLAGKRVSVVYEHHKGVPTSCFGNTEYFVVGVEPAE